MKANDRKVIWPIAALAAISLVAIIAHNRANAPLAAIPPPQDRPIALASRSVLPSDCARQAATNAPALSVRGTCAYAIQASGPVTAVVRSRVAAFGGRVIAYLPTDALLVEASPSVIRALLATKEFTAAFAYLPTDKVQRGLTAGLVTIIPLDAEDRERLIAFVRAENGSPLLSGPSRKGSFRAEVSDALIWKLAARGDVRWLERYAPPKVSNDYATKDTGVQQVWNVHGLTGAGQVIASADSGLDTGDRSNLHKDFGSRVIQIVNLGGYTLMDGNGHGTHTAGTIAGDGTQSSGKYSGVAPKAQLYIQACGNGTSSGSISFNNADTYSDIFAGGVGSGAYIHSDSWGDDDEGAYSEFSAALDEIMWDCPELLVVVAAGNSGLWGAQTVGSPATAKNALAVGNANSSRSGSDVTKIVSSSSRGPCADGRIKPDLTAPGRNIISTRSTKSKCSAVETYYTKMSGTSMATPHVAGCAALTRQWLAERQGFTNALPTSALLKAILTGGAIGTTPDNTFGWGRLSLEETLFPSDRRVRLIDHIPYGHGSTTRYVVTTTNAAPLDVQLAWTDFPGDASAAIKLVNDLDLVVSNRETGAVWTGNGVAGGDHTNNIECVRIPTAAAGEYVIEVTGTRIPYEYTAGGAAALYVRGALGEDQTEETVTLTVDVEGPENLRYDTDPAAGTHAYPKGSDVTLTAGYAYATNSNGTLLSLYECQGYDGTGLASASNKSTKIAMTLTNDAAIVWHYAVKPAAHALRFYTYNPGYDWFLPDGFDVARLFLNRNLWIRTNATVTVSFPADLPYRNGYYYEGTVYSYSYQYGFVDREDELVMILGEVELSEADEDGDILYDDRLRMANKTTFVMDRAKDICGYYYDSQLTSDGGLPMWWFCRFLKGGLEAETLTEDEVSSTGDPDGDGFANAAEYDDGTDPVDDESFRFRIDSFSPTNLCFTGSIKGTLVVERSETPGGEWQAIHSDSTARTSTTNSVRLNAGTATGGFFRVIHHPNGK